MKQNILMYSLGIFFLGAAAGSFGATLTNYAATSYPASSALGTVVLSVGLIFSFSSLNKRLNDISKQIHDSKNSSDNPE